MPSQKYGISRHAVWQLPGCRGARNNVGILVFTWQGRREDTNTSSEAERAMPETNAGVPGQAPALLYSKPEGVDSGVADVEAGGRTLVQKSGGRRGFKEVLRKSARNDMLRSRIPCLPEAVSREIFLGWRSVMKSSFIAEMRHMHNWFSTIVPKPIQGLMFVSLMFLIYFFLLDACPPGEVC